MWIKLLLLFLSGFPDPAEPEVPKMELLVELIVSENLPYRTFHNFRALQSVERQTIG